ncbi:hypothetical protein [Brevibacterium luteolum]|uniref:hypothetical protein n=1 Tax=Brevibacterium luteolum TaxID=199591 RepID=UPI003B66D336
MEASITVLIALVVLFAFTLPAILRRTDRAVAQRELSEVPETAEICQLPAAEPCTEEPARPELFTASTPASRYTPPPGVEVVTEPAQLSLRRPAPALSVIDGGAEDTAAEAVTAEAGAADAETAEAEYIELPLAAGQTLALTQLHTAAQTTTLRDRRPDNHLDAMMTNTPDAGSSPTHRSRPAAMPAHLRRHLDTARTQTATGARRPAGPGAGAARPGVGAARPGAGTGSHRPRGGAPQAGTGHPARRPASTIDGQTAEKIAGIRSIIPMVSVVFLGMLAATLVTAVLAAFSVVPWAVPLLTALIAAGSVVLVGSLNKRVRTLRREAAAPAAHTACSYEPARGTERQAAQRAQQRRTAEVVSARRAHAAEVLDSSEPSQPASVPASSQARRFPRHILDIDETPAAETTTADDTAAEPATAAAPTPAAAEVAETEVPADTSVEGQAVEAMRDDEDSNTAHDTTVIVSRTTEAALSLSFGPKPAKDEDTAEAGETAETEAAESAAEAEAEVRAETAAEGEPAETVGADPFAQRLQATGWKPSPLPKPTYVDAPVVERDQPEPVVADATSFTLEPQSKESLAEMFAAELGYRPELQDAARDEDAESGPLAHGRTAIRFKATGTDSGAGVASIDDVLARRRA